MSERRIAQLLKMANQIALNLGAGTDPEGAALRTAEHLRKFWTRDMLARLREYDAQGGEDLEPAVQRALALPESH